MNKFLLRNLQICFLSASIMFCLRGFGFSIAFLFISFCLIGLFICGVLPIKNEERNNSDEKK